MTRRLLLFAAFIGFAAVLLPVQATDSDVAQGGALDRRTYKQCEEGEFLNTFTGQCSECFECPEGFYERIACSQMSNTLCSSCRSFLVIRNDDYILKCEGGEEKPRLTFFEMLRQRIESTRKQRLEDGLPKLRVEKIVDSSEEDGEEEEAPKVLDGVANVNLLDDSDEDDDTVLAKDFEKEIAARQQEDEDSDSQEEEAVKEDTDDSDDDDDEEEIAVKAVPVADDDEESDSSEEDRENDLPPLPSRDEEDDDSDDESVEEPSRPLIPIREIELEDLADDSDSESVEEEKDVKESAEEMPYDSVQPIARIIIIQNRDQDDSDDSDDSKDSSEEIAAPRLPPRPRYSSESDSDSDSDSDSSESDEEEEVYFGKRNNYKNSQLSVVHFVWRIVLFALFVAALIAFRQFCCRPTNTYQRHVTVVPAFTPEQLGFVSRAADNLKQKVNGNDIKYEKLVEPKPEFV